MVGCARWKSSMAAFNTGANSRPWAWCQKRIVTGPDAVPPHLLPRVKS